MHEKTEFPPRNRHERRAAAAKARRGVHGEFRRPIVPALSIDPMDVTARRDERRRARNRRKAEGPRVAATTSSIPPRRAERRAASWLDRRMKLTSERRAVIDRAPEAARRLVATAKPLLVRNMARGTTLPPNRTREQARRLRQAAASASA